MPGLFGLSPGLGSCTQAHASDPRRPKTNAWDACLCQADRLIFTAIFRDTCYFQQQRHNQLVSKAMYCCVAKYVMAFLKQRNTVISKYYSITCLRFLNCGFTILQFKKTATPKRSLSLQKNSVSIDIQIQIQILEAGYLKPNFILLLRTLFSSSDLPL